MKMSSLFGQGEFFIFHCILWCFVCRLYQKHYDSLLLITHQTPLHSSQDWMTFKPNVLSDFLSRFEVISMMKFFSFLIPLVESATLFFCSYSFPLPSFTHSVFNLSSWGFTLCPHFHPSLAFGSPFIVIMDIFLPFLKLPVLVDNPWFLHSMFIKRVKFHSH